MTVMMTIKHTNERMFKISRDIPVWLPDELHNMRYLSRCPALPYMLLNLQTLQFRTYSAICTILIGKDMKKDIFGRNSS